MREFLELLKKNRMLEVVRKKVSPDMGLTGFLKDTEKSFLFRSLGSGKFSIAANLLTDRKRIALALGCSESDVLGKINRAIESPRKCRLVWEAGFMEKEISFDEIPIPRYFPSDGGQYLTSAVVIARDCEHGQNMAFHRMMKRKDHLVIRLLPRHTWEFYERAKKSLDIAICIGTSPSVLLAAAINTKIGVNELEIASALEKKPIEVFDVNGLQVPANSEIVIEATITPEMEDEGPFVDITRTIDFVRKQPVVRIKKIHCRKNPLFHALLPGGFEHGAIWKASTEAAIFNSVKKVCDCRDVFLSFGGCSRLHGIVKIRKRREDDGKKSIEASFGAHKSMKHVFVVDEDIDIQNPSEVEWAIATRFQAKRDLVIMHDQKGSSLDPSSDDGITSKLGFDCTVKGKKDDFRKFF